MPRYSTGYYFSEPTRPTTSETRVFASYKEHFNYPRTVKEMIQRIQQSNEVPVGKVIIKNCLKPTQLSYSVESVGVRFSG